MFEGSKCISLDFTQTAVDVDEQLSLTPMMIQQSAVTLAVVCTASQPLKDVPGRTHSLAHA